MDHHQWYIGHPKLGPTLTIGTQAAAWQRCLINRDEMSLRQPYWPDNTLPLSSKVFGMEKCSITYASQKLRIIYDKGWYGRHKLKTIQDYTEDLPLDSLCSLRMITDSLRHWASECQDMALATCRVEILTSLPMPEDDMPKHIFTREISLLIPQLLRVKIILLIDIL